MQACNHDPEFNQPGKPVKFWSWQVRFPMRWWVLMFCSVYVSVFIGDILRHGVSVINIMPIYGGVAGMVIFWGLDKFLSEN
jgi:hypothetical protein